jgi:heme/copper-type cytochrome/quinol oxidase subunit 1
MTTVNLPSTLGAEATADSGFLGSVAAWLTTTDHKRIGRLFIGTAVLWLLAFGGVASLLGFERIDSKSLTLNEGMMTQLFAASKTLASFGVMVPLMLGLSLALAPTQVGSRSVMFARNAMLGFYLWAIGSAVVVASLIGNGGPGGGNAQMVDLYLLGLALVMLGLLAAAVSVVATVLSARTAGTDLADVPSFAWSSMIGSISLVLTLPVALGTLIYVAVDHHYTRVAFEANMGIMKWLGWSMSQPQTFLYVIPAIGILAELAPAVARRAQPLRGGVFVGVGLISVALLGSVTQTVHGLAWTGTLIDKAKSFVPYALFNLLPILGVVVVLALALFALKSDSIKMIAPFIPAFLGGGMILTAMLGNALQLISSANLAGTVFEEGVLVYISYGTVLVAWSAIAFWGPTLWGRMLPAKAVAGIGALGFVATVLAALPMYIAGFADQQADSVKDFDYSGPASLWNAVSTAGHALFAVCVIAAIATAAKSFATGERVAGNPWIDGGAQ